MEIARMLAANAAYVSSHQPVPEDSRPTRRIAVLTCMDARIDVFAALGLQLGEAHVLRNAGGRVTEDVLRSLALSTQVLGTDTIVLMQHSRCGLAGVTDEELQERTGADLGFHPIADHTEALNEDIATLTSQAFLAGVPRFVGLLFDIDTGALSEAVRVERDV